MPNVFGELVHAQIENLAADPANLPDGRVWLDTATSKPKVVIGAAAKNMVTEDSTATLTNKTIVAADNTITTAASGNLAATNLNSALAELQTDIDTRITASSSDVLTNKTINGSNNTLSNVPVGSATGTLALGNGGTGQTTKAAAFDALSPMTTSGDVIYGGASGTGTRLAKGSDGQVLTLASGLPSWAAVTTTTSAPTYQILTSGTGATYTRPSGPAPSWLRIRMVGGGGSGGSNSDTAGTIIAGNPGGTTTFNSINANGGGGSVGTNTISSGVGGLGGTGGTGSATLRIPGHSGGPSGANSSGQFSGWGGNSQLGPGAPAFQPASTNGVNNAIANTGGGGSGYSRGSNWVAPGGGGGEYAEIIISSPAATYTYTVGAGGIATAGAIGTGGTGGSGIIIVEEYY